MSPIREKFVNVNDKDLRRKWRNYMKIAVDDLARQSLIDIYYSKNAMRNGPFWQFFAKKVHPQK